MALIEGGLHRDDQEDANNGIIGDTDVIRIQSTYFAKKCLDCSDSSSTHSCIHLRLSSDQPWTSSDRHQSLVLHIPMTDSDRSPGWPVGQIVSSHLPCDYRKFCLSYAYMFFISFWESFMAVLSNVRLPNPAQYPPLPDIVLENLPFIPSAFHWAELMTICLGFILFIAVLVHKHRFIVLRRFFVIAASISTIRAVSIVITSLPVPSTHMPCHTQSFISFWSMAQRSLSILFGAGLTINGIYNCGDFIFSGHTVMLTLFHYFIVEYTPRRMRLLHIVSWIVCLSAMFLIMVSREHYSVDVFLAFFVASQIFLYYHSLADSGPVGRNCDRSTARLWIPLISYFESSIDGPVPNEYEYPLYSFVADMKLRFCAKSSVRHRSNGSCSPSTPYSSV